MRLYSFALFSLFIERLVPATCKLLNARHINAAIEQIVAHGTHVDTQEMPIHMDRVATERGRLRCNVFFKKCKYLLFSLFCCYCAFRNCFFNTTFIVSGTGGTGNVIEWSLVDMYDDIRAFCYDIQILIGQYDGYFDDFIGEYVTKRCHFEVHPD